MATESKGKLKFILGFVAFFAALWFLWDTSLAYPLKIFVVLLHEISHAIASVATGGGIEKITLDPRQGGACYCFGGSAFITLTAGYLGSLFWGATMFTAARSDKVRTDWVNGFIGVMVVILTLFFVRGSFGMMFGIAFGLTMFMAAKKVGRDDPPAGTEFDSSEDRGPYRFALGAGKVIRATDLAVAAMAYGERAEVVARSDYAYGKDGLRRRDGEVVVPPYATLRVDITLLGKDEEGE